ncbi:MULTISPECIES: high frequency lysogenization protein HflD [Methylomonas]|uniref:High frequency lysogenization protein HflD homolog n=2 Tax=Methylomonas TaxID=416 RepID=A0A140E4I8_9GAMM|nr:MULTISPECIES: high frequency lysogenization protein HflD [Methylomonas]AMK75312.1 lysogenization protein HflD [Methylomonas denitrificans]OAH99296.1 lysogenization protein HflD [Methylomonas methanica]TCV84941.1 high frequency lysogenization protein [Methylomonas methanica]
MSLNTLSNQTIALAGIAQACSLVHQLASTGNCQSAALEASIASLLKIDADSVVDVYGGLIGVEHGLQQLTTQLGSRVLASPEQARYAAQIVYLQKQLATKPDMQKTIQAGVSKAQAQVEHFGVLHENVLANLADVYHSTISTLQPRIMVQGDQQYLGNQSTVNKIRALLLAGIRATLLWRQCGGSRWKLLFFRKKIQDEAKFLLTQI